MNGGITAGEAIRKMRKSKGLTQIEVAKRAGISVNSLRLYEADKRNPKINHLQAILKALGEDGTLTDYGMRSIKRQEAKDSVLLKIASALKIDPVELEKKLETELGIADDSFLQSNTNSNEEKLLSVFYLLNDEGQGKAVERVEELTEIPKYKK